MTTETFFSDWSVMTIDLALRVSAVCIFETPVQLSLSNCWPSFAIIEVLCCLLFMSWTSEWGHRCYLWFHKTEINWW